MFCLFITVCCSPIFKRNDILSACTLYRHSTIVLFLRCYSTSLLKTLWKKEKWLVKNTVSFSNIVFYPFITNSSTHFTPPQTKFVGIYWNQPFGRSGSLAVGLSAKSCPDNSYSFRQIPLILGGSDHYKL